MNRTRRTAAALAAACAALVLTSSCSTPGQPADPTRPDAGHTPGSPVPTHPTAPAPTSRPDPRPNIVLISTDDETMSDMAWMPRTRRALARGGVTFPNMLSPHPLCCPARAEILTGQYAQNNGVRSNKAELLGGFHRLDSSRTIATWLTAAGYRTAFVGKYLNQYHARDGREPGWTIWNPTITNVYGYFNYTMFNNGHPKHYTTLHNADLVGRKTNQYIRQLSGDRPFFIWASHVAPHGACEPSQELTCWAPPIPAKRHAHLFADTQSPSFNDPAFNEADVSDKPYNIRTMAPADPDFINTDFRARIRSLQAVDEAVASNIDTLRRTGELDNTVVMFTSDNGYLLGEHRYVFKNVPYEQALRVPLLVRGPGITPGSVRTQGVTTVDLAPTIAALAHAHPDLPVDGRSFWPTITDPAHTLRDTVLIQSGPRNTAELAFGWAFRGVRTARYTYVHYPLTGFSELYDRQRDPAELDNVAGQDAYAATEAELARRAAALEGCAGANCSRTFGPVPDPDLP